MLFVFTVGGETLQIFAANRAQALQRAQAVYPGQNIEGLRESGQSGDANIRIISPTSVDGSGNPVFTPAGTSDVPLTDRPRFDQPSGDVQPSGQSGTLGLPPLEEQGLGAIFSQFLQDQGAASGINPLASNFAQGQGPLAQQLFGAAQRIGGGFDGVPETEQFQNFLSRTPNFGTQSLASTALTDISNAVRAGVTPGSEMAAAFAPQNVAESADLGNLARTLAGRNVSPFIQRAFFARPGLTNDALFNTFAASRDRGDTGGFAQFLGSRFGLPNFQAQLGF